MADSCFEERPAGRLGEEDLHPWQDVSHNDSSPFVHRFRTRGQKYVYDVNTHRIIRVSSVVWDVLEDFGCMDDRRIMAKHSSSHSTEEVAAALRQIASVREQEGLFLSFRPKEVLPPKRENIQERLDQQREQLTLNVTEDCNFRCSYCVFGDKYRHHRAHSAKAMSWDVARPAIDEFLSHSVSSEDRVITFYGGEPLLNLPLIRQCVAYARRNCGDLGVRFGVTTNGYLLKGEAARFLAGEGFSIVVSLDGPAEIHDRHRRTKGGAPTWDQVVSNVRDLLATYPDYRTNGHIRFNAVATRSTDLCEVQGFFCSCELFADSMGLEISEQSQSPGEVNAVLPDDLLAVSGSALYQEFIQGLKSGLLKDEHGCRSRWVQTSTFQKPFVLFHKRGYLSPHLPEKMVFLNTCVPGARKTFVNANGDYFACERVVESQEGIIGNVGEGVDVARVVALLDRWNRAGGDQCRYCWCLPTCQVGCFATVGEDGTVTQEAKRRACAVCRHRTHQLLMEYCSILEENPKAFDYAAKLGFA